MSDIRIPVKITQNDITRFVLIDALRRCAPLLAAALACAGYMTWYHFYNARQTPMLGAALLTVVSVGAVALLLFYNARRMALEAQKKKKITAYIFNEDCLIIMRGDQEQRQPWDDMKRLRVVSATLVFYCAGRRAYLLPLRDLHDLPGPAHNHVIETLSEAFGKSMIVIK